MTTVDLITQEVIRARLDGIVREMEAAVFRTGFSTIVRESHDFSCGLLDREGRVVGQSNHPSHMGAYPYCIAGLLQFYSYDEMREGDAFLANHPYYSGTPHANDMVVMTPIFVDGRVVAFAASMGHTPDTGGVSPGSRNATARDLFGEGLQITPVRYMRDRELVRDTASFVRANSRVPDMMIGDLSAKAGVCFAIGAQRLHDVIAAYGADVVLQTFDDLGDRTERQARQYISEWQDGVHEAETWVDDPTSPDKPIRLHVAAIKEGDSLILDFTGTGDQAEAPINVRPPFVHGLAFRAVVAMTDPFMPLNHGLTRAVECRFREGSLVNPTFPGPGRVLLEDAVHRRERADDRDGQGGGESRDCARVDAELDRYRAVGERREAVRPVRADVRGEPRLGRRGRLHRDGARLRRRQVHERRDHRVRVRRGDDEVRADAGHGRRRQVPRRSGVRPRVSCAVGPPALRRRGKARGERD